jgi:hypothetical protein
MELDEARELEEVTGRILANLQAITELYNSDKFPNDDSLNEIAAKASTLRADLEAIAEN